MSLNYESSGVRYDQLDAFKRACQAAARSTVGLLANHGYTEPAAARGESAYQIEAADHFLAHVEEGLGTKNLVADAVYAATGKCFYHEIAIDTVATIVNDLITCGARPISVAMHAAVGDSGWFTDALRMQALVNGWAEVCRRAGAVWGVGETPTLKGLVDNGSIILAGSAIGKIAPKSRRISGEVRDGDAIIFLASTGVQTNGLSLCRLIAEELAGGYQTPLGHGDPRTFGEALLAASAIYVDFVVRCQEAGVRLNYVAHVTGHGWRKLMRPDEPFVYEINETGEIPALFKFLMASGPVEPREAYATFNMGVGFAAYVDPSEVAGTLAAAEATGHRAWVAGRVVKAGTRKAVLIPSLDLAYEAGTLQLRGTTRSPIG